MIAREIPTPRRSAKPNGTTGKKSARSAALAPRAKRASPLRRSIHPMPAFVKKALSARRLTSAYRSRPRYQQNDYIGWITSAQRESTQQKRLQQMLDELAGGRLYMNMKWSQGQRAHG